MRRQPGNRGEKLPNSCWGSSIPSSATKLPPVWVAPHRHEPLNLHPLLNDHGPAVLEPHGDHQGGPAVAVPPPVEHQALHRRHLKAGLGNPNEPGVARLRPLLVAPVLPHSTIR